MTPVEQRVADGFFQCFRPFLELLPVRGSVRIGFSRYTEEIDVTAYERPDGKITAIFLNKADRLLPVCLRMNGQMAQMLLFPRVADKTRKAAKSRNLIAVLAIALTALLFTSVFTIGGSIVEKQQEATMRQVGGSAHGGLKYLTQEEYDILKKDKKLKEISYRIVVGEAVNESLKKLRTEMGYYEDLDAKFSFCYPEVGHMPEAEDEIVTSDLVLKAMGIPCQVGEKVPVEFTVKDKRYERTFTLTGYFKGDTISMSQIMLVSKKLADEVAPTPTVSAMSSNIDASDYAGRIMADFNFRNSLDLTGKMEDLAKRCGFPQETVSEGINWAYMGMDINIEDMLPIAALLAVILVSAVLCFSCSLLASLRPLLITQFISQVLHLSSSSFVTLPSR